MSEPLTYFSVYSKRVSEDVAMSGFMLYLRVKAAAMAGIGAIFFVFVLPKLG
ncbi:MAG TPA: hypothetical protein VIB07_08855 [Nitrososphaera sp.]